MGLFSKAFKSKDSSSVRSRNAGAGGLADGSAAPQQKQSYDDGWARKSVAPHEVQELINVCTQEMKSRALDTPFLLLPFRPTAENHISAARTFVRSFFKQVGSAQYKGESLSRELRLYDPMVLCSIVKWCWSRLPGGVVTWSTYELFKEGEKESKFAKHAFDTLIPLSVDSEARKFIVLDFFDLLAAIAAHGKTNGLGGRKLSRLAGWWAFEHSDNGNGFNGGYRSWAHAADATCHMFFAHLRSLAPDPVAGSSGISQLPRSLQSLVSQTEYPPETPILLQTETSKVNMVVDSVSPTPFALLRRAKHFEYREADEGLQKFSAFEDPVKALTFECRRVLESISATNRSANVTSVLNNSVKSVGPNNAQADASWSRFEDLGFSSLLDGPSHDNNQGFMSRPSDVDGPQHKAASVLTDFGRPTTPSWADFLSSGFADDASSRGPASLLLPPDQILPPLSPQRVQSSQSHVRGAMGEKMLEPGELASVTRIALDETFWWVWMTSLSGEEPAARKAVFGRCAFLETEIPRTRWLIIEEQVKGAAAKAPENALLVEKKSRFNLSKKDRTRRSSTGKKPVPNPKDLLKKNSTNNESKLSIGAEQRAKVQAAAAGLVEGKKPSESAAQVAERRGRLDDNSQSKTQSVMTLQPVIMKEAAPAMQWARKFDKETIRAKYLGDVDAGKGDSLVAAASPPEQPKTVEPSEPAPVVATQTNGQAVGGVPEPMPSMGYDVSSAPTKMPAPPASNHTERKPVPASPSALQTNVATKKQNSTGSPKSPAAAAAAAAAASAALASASASKSTNDSNQDVAAPHLRSVKSKQGSTRNLINLFNKKKQQDAADSRSSEDHLSVGEGQVTRKRSLLGRRTSPRDVIEEAPSSSITTSQRQDAARVAAPTPVAEPVVAAPAAQAAAAAMYQQNGKNDSTSRFSNFTQGTQEGAGHQEREAPVADEPILASSPPDSPLAPIVDHREATIPEVQAPIDEVENGAPHADGPIAADEPQVVAGTSEEVEPAEEGEVLTKQISHDRWAQIRKNAADRARKNNESNEDKTDDGDTSGEETIESRVARIKARVAELTGQQRAEAAAST